MRKTILVCALVGLAAVALPLAARADPGTARNPEAVTRESTKATARRHSSQET